MLGAALTILSASIYYYVGHTLSRRRITSPDVRLAWTHFVVWWYTLASNTLISGLLSLLGAFNIASLPLFITITQINMLVLCVALYGLMYYLLYLFTGKRSLFAPLIVFYLICYTLLVYWVYMRVPVAIIVGRWNATVQYEHQAQGPFFIILLIMLVFPQIIGSLAYFTLYFQVKTTTQKYRILLVSWSIIIWFLSAFLASASGISQQDWWQIVSRLIGLSAALAIMLAYQPISWIKHRFGVLSIAEDPL